MSFFARKRQRKTIVKKKWEVDSDPEEDTVNVKKNSDEDQPQEMICKMCNGARDADLFCLDCKAYYCRKCFEDSHKEETASKDASGTSSEVPEEEKKGDSKAHHKIRPLVGCTNLNTLLVGWIVGEEKSQPEQKRDRERMEKEKAAEERRRKAAEKAAEIERKRKALEAKLEATKKAIAAASEQAIGARDAQGPPPPTPPTRPPSVSDLNRHIFVSNIHFSVKTSDLRNLFKKCGRIVQLSMPSNRKRPLTGQGMQVPTHRGIAFIEFDSKDGADSALKLDGHVIQYRPIRVCIDQLGPSRSQQQSKPAGLPYKTKMCMYFQQGKCFRGDSCSFAHHPREIKKGVFIQKPSTGEASVDGGFKW
mmetsp:Transcript_14391/g.21862  ORF Transcript_14391/g.21862 Transcript_14391/m.21862 type:complete len:363 (+) Transcript_14391:66-1154(+)